MASAIYDNEIHKVGATIQYMKNILHLPIMIILSSCHNDFQESLFVDNYVSPSSLEQIIPSANRADVGVGYFSDSSSLVTRRFQYNSYKNKSWIISNWGKPDLVEKNNQIEYLIYFRGDSRKIKSEISSYGKKHVKLGYKNGNLVYIEAIVPNAMEHSGKRRVILKN